MLRPTTNLRRVLQLAADPEVAPRRLLAAIEQEPSLTDSIVRYVGTFYGKRARTADLTRAVQMLGILSVAHVATVHTVALALARAELPENITKALWSDLVHRALMARRVARRTHEPHPDFAFAVGLCLEFGIAALMEREGHFIPWMCDIRPLVGPQRLAAERSLFGQDHMAAFEALSREWELAPALVAAVLTHHEDPRSDASRADVGLRSVAFWSDRLGEALSAANAEQELQRWSFGFGRSVEMSTEDAWALAEWVLDHTEDAAEAIGGAAGTQPTLASLRTGGAAAADITVDDVRAYADQLEEENKALERRVEELVLEVAAARDRDAVTGLPSHAGCLSRLAKMIAASHADRSGVFVVLVDIDGFTALNARHGYEQGDVVLARAAAALRSVLRGSEHLSRVGPDVFGILVAGDARQGRLTGERARAAIEALRLDVGQGRLRITATVAGVGLDEIGRDAGPGFLMASAFHVLNEHRGHVGNRVWWHTAAAGRTRRVG